MSEQEKSFKYIYNERLQVPDTDPGFKREREIPPDPTEIFGAQALLEYSQSIYREYEPFFEKWMQEIKDLREKQARPLTDDEKSRINFLKSKPPADIYQMEIDDLTERVERYRKYEPEGCRKDMGDVLFLFLKMQGKEKDPRYEYLKKELQCMFFPDDETVEQLKQYFDENATQLKPIDFWIKVKNKTIPAELLMKFLVVHFERVQEQQKFLERIVPEIKNEFKEAVTEAVEQGLLPASVIQVVDRIDDIQVWLKDELFTLVKDNSQNDATTKLGTFNAWGHVMVNNILFKDSEEDTLRNIKETLFHEFMHELSGRSLSMRHHVDFAKQEFPVLKKVGTQIRQRYTWLNEAITEWLTLKLIGAQYDESDMTQYKGSQSYIKERKELDRLISLGLEEEVILAAYFQNFLSSDQPQEHHGKGFAQLVKSINQIEGQYGFTKLENSFTLDKAVQSLFGPRSGYFSPGAINHETVREQVGNDARIFTIDLSLGIREESVVSQKFSYVVWPIGTGEGTITTNEQVGDLIKELNDLKSQFRPRLSFTFSEQNLTST